MTQYVKIFGDHVKKLHALKKEKVKIDSEIEKVLQMMRATLNLMPKEEKKVFVDVINAFKIHEKGLTAAVRSILQSNLQEWLTAVQIRDRLQESGFDFGGYTSNPLVSVHTVLKRLKPGEVERKVLIDGTNEYRWKKREAIEQRLGAIQGDSQK